MAGNIGFYKRTTRKLNVNTGSRLTDVSKLTRALPNAEGVSYYSGQPLWVTSSAKLTVDGAPVQVTYSATPPVLNTIDEGKVAPANGGTLVDAEWRWTTTPVAGTPVYFAFQDSDEWDGSGKNMAVSTLDKFELQTPFYDTTKVYTAGMPLTAKLVSDLALATFPIGNRPRVVAPGTDPETQFNAVLVCPAASGDDIIGYVTAGVVNVSGDANVSMGEVDSSYKVVVGGPVVWTESSDTRTVLQFETAWNHQVA